MSTDYDKDLINREVVAVCDHYLTSKRGEGKRQTYDCPSCGDRNFEVDPERGYAGCLDAACEAPTTTDALGIIAYFEGKDLSGEGFVMCLKKGYEILGMLDPEEENDAPQSTNGANRPKAMTPRRERSAGREKAMTPRVDRGGEQDEPANGDGGVHSSGPQWGAAAVQQTDSSDFALMEQPIQAWQENEDGTRSPVAAVVIREPEPDAQTQDSEELEDAEFAEEAVRQTDRQTDERQTAHEVFEEVLRLCRREDRDERFLLGRGLDQRTIEEGRFGSISKSRCNYVISRLRKKFSDEELLTVPGFRKTEGGQVRFSLYGDYALMPYHDGEGYIRTVEGRFTGEEMGEYDKKYKALLNSAVHLYVHPRYKPSEVVAICEGAIGAMVAARYGFAVASIKGMRNYRCRLNGGGNLYTVLPELEGVDFAGKVVVYIPDLDVKPQTREEALSLVPEACQWMIERQGGIPKVAMLPEGAKDLDAWILSLDEAEREEKLAELLDGAISLEQFKQQYLDTASEQDEQPNLSEGGSQKQETNRRVETSEDDGSSTEQVGEQEKPEPTASKRQVFGDSDKQKDTNESRTASGEDGGQQPLEGFEDTNKDVADNERVQNTGKGDEPQPAPNRQEYGEGSGDGSQTDKHSNHEQQEGTGKGGENSGEENEHPPDEGQARSRNEQAEDDTTEMEPVTDDPHHRPVPAAFEVRTRGEWALTTVVYVAAAILLTILIHVLTARYVGWFEPPLWWEAGLAAFTAIWVTAGFRKLRKGRKEKSLLRHIEGPDV